MEKFEGIMFALKKTAVNTTCRSNEDIDYVVFGYYDGLSIITIDKWYGFRPMGVADQCGYVKLGEKFTDIYAIKGVFPNPKSQLWNNSNFNYSLWKEIGQSEKSVLSEKILSKSPYICVSSIHLSEEFVRQCEGLEDMIDKLVYCITNISKQHDLALQEQYCAIFPTIGFSDFIISFVAEDLEVPGKLIKYLRESKYNKCAILSNCYTICGINKNYRINYENCKLDSQIRLSVGFNLMKGISAEKFHGELSRCVLETMKKLSISEEELSNVTNELQEYYVTFGDVDTLVMPDINMESYLSFFILQPGENGYNDSIWKSVTSTKTSIHIKDQASEIANDTLIGACNKGNVQKDKWIEYAYKFEDSLKKNNYAVRMSRSIEQIIQNYYNIAEASHGFSIQQSLSKFIEAVFKNIMICCDNSEIDWNYTTKSVCEFRDKVGDYIADLLKSDKPFVEGNSLLHPAIGTATKILFAYTSIMNELAGMFKDDDNEIVFLVISGGADRTTAVDLFQFLNRNNMKNTEGYCRPVLIIVPEKGLYDLKGTLFRMLHECMHFCGERNRKKRYNTFVNMLAAIMANDIGTNYIEENNSIKFINSAMMYVSDEMEKEVCKELEIILKDSQKETVCKLYDYIKNYSVFLNYHTDDILDQYYEYCLFHLYDKSNRTGVLSSERMAELLFEDEYRFRQGLADILNQQETLYHKKINEKLHERKIDVFISDLQAMQMEYQKSYGEDQRINTYLDVYTAVFVDNYGYGLVKAYNKFYSYNYIQRLGFWSMREARADLCAVKLLKMEVSDYLLAFIYEEKDINRAMPLTFDNVLRIGSVLKLGFNITKDQFASVKIQVKDKALCIKEKGGFAYEIKDGDTEEYIESYLSLVEELLGVYNEGDCVLVSSFLEEYLSETTETFDNCNENLLNELRCIYAKCDMTDDKVYDVIDFLFKKWQQLVRRT